MKKTILLIVIFFTIMPRLFAGDKDSLALLQKQVNDYVRLIDSVNKAMNYQTGTISLPAQVVQLNVPKGFKYLGLEQSKYVVEELWGNLPQSNLQGMLFPENGGPFDDSSYAYIITYSPMGYIKDAEARDINYDDVLKQIKQGDEEENKKRVAMGGQNMYTQGWAAKPYYDSEKKVLYWALEIKMDNADENTLNYKIISLGRKGMLLMNAVAGMGQLDAVKADAPKVLSMAAYTPGNQYKDFDSNVDEVAAWTIGGLVAGKILTGAAGKSILYFLKYIVLGIIAAGGAVWRWITGRKKTGTEM